MMQPANELNHVVSGKGPGVTLGHSLAEALAHGIDGARLQVIRGTAHQAKIEQPVDFHAQIGKFLAGNA